jgi:hypothetical protein
MRESVRRDGKCRTRHRLDPTNHAEPLLDMSDAANGIFECFIG